MKAEILAVGSELLTPYRQDTNSLFLTEQLNTLGVEVIAKTIVGDRQSEIVTAVRHALDRADILLTSGGLGPTLDDLTREAVAEALGVEVVRDSDVLTSLYKRFAERRMPMPENNVRQADKVAGAEILTNPAGTAPGQWIDTTWKGHRKLIAMLPGVPRELKALCEAEVVLRLAAVIRVRHMARRMLRIALLPESQVDSRVAPIYSQYKDVDTTILAALGEIQLHFSCAAKSREHAEKRVAEVCERVEEELGDDVFSANGDSLEQVVLYFLEMQGATLATAESLTGGLIAQRLTSVANASRTFIGGAVVYTNDLKKDFAEVPDAVLQKHGAVSRATAQAMAEGIRHRTGATLGVAVTGVAGPGGGTEQTPVGTVYAALADEEDTQVVERRFVGDRERIRYSTSQLALDLVRRKLM